MCVDSTCVKYHLYGFVYIQNICALLYNFKHVFYDNYIVQNYHLYKISEVFCIFQNISVELFMCSFFFMQVLHDFSQLVVVVTYLGHKPLLGLF